MPCLKNGKELSKPLFSMPKLCVEVSKLNASRTQTVFDLQWPLGLVIHFRRVATRYDKTDESFPAFVHLVTLFVVIK